MPGVNQEWSFVSVGQQGKLKNATDRSTIRKVAMQSFRRKERAERVKSFAKERAVQTQIEEISTVARLDLKSPGFPPDTSVALQCISEEPLLQPDGHCETDMQVSVPIKFDPSPISPVSYWFNAPAVNSIPRCLGIPAASVIGDSSVINYLFDYCMSPYVSLWVIY